MNFWRLNLLALPLLATFGCSGSKGKPMQVEGACKAGETKVDGKCAPSTAGGSTGTSPYDSGGTPTATATDTYTDPSTDTSLSTDTLLNTDSSTDSTTDTSSSTSTESGYGGAGGAGTRPGTNTRTGTGTGTGTGYGTGGYGTGTGTGTGTNSNRGTGTNTYRPGSTYPNTNSNTNSNTNTNYGTNTTAGTQTGLGRGTGTFSTTSTGNTTGTNLGTTSFSGAPTTVNDGAPHVKLILAIRDRKLLAHVALSHKDQVTDFRYEYKKTKTTLEAGTTATNGDYTVRTFHVPVLIQFKFNGRDCQTEQLASFTEKTYAPTCN